MTDFSFKILKRDSKTGARAGILKTKTGEYETPFFMPVATKGATKYIDVESLEEIGADALISNAFLLYLKPGLRVIKKHKNIHNFMNWKKCIFTDSGGFQVLSMDKFKGRFSDNALTFKSPFDGSKHLLTPEKVTEIQETLGSDVAMVLDHMPLFSYSKNEVEIATKRTHLFAVKSLKAKKDKRQLLFGIIQGGTFSDLRKQSAKFISSLDFNGIALGGLGIGEPSEKTLEMIKVSCDIIPENKPRYLMGVGSTVEIIEAISLGIDIFDSAWPTRNARHGRVMTKKYDYDIEKIKFKGDLKPLDENCYCKICKSYSRAYIHHLLKMREPLGMKLLTYHNLYFLQNLMKKIRESISRGDFIKLKKILVKKRLNSSQFSFSFFD